jgi:hypothetical protein
MGFQRVSSQMDPVDGEEWVFELKLKEPYL